MDEGIFYKADWDEVREEYKRFWRLENEKPLVAIRTVRDKPVKEIKPLPLPPEIAKVKSRIRLQSGRDADFKDILWGSSHSLSISNFRSGYASRLFRG